MPWRRRQEIPDAQVLDAADQYEAASRVLWAQLSEGGILLPFLNVSVTAVELYLKSLSSQLVFVPQEDGCEIVYANPDEFTHSPSKLLEVIPEDVRARMETEFLKRPDREGATLLDRCSAYDELFKSSRYPFDRKLNLNGIRVATLRDFVAFLKEFVSSYQAEERITWRDPEGISGDAVPD